ncbi:flagellar biosynthetic protein FliR [Lacipirellula sp.]|uniref:flagellar biosynthetic protein FliR n=1 Tax=Lacipirellula sp. TaxID=2691419 RepID=UPI003D0C93F6
MNINAALLEPFLVQQLGTFTLVLARVGALMMTAPIFGPRSAPFQARALLAFAMAIIITPLHASQAPVDMRNIMAFSHFVLNETLIGLLLGLGLMILLSGIQLTGQIISQLGGTALAEGYDVMSEESLPVYSQLFYFLTLTMFVLLGGHRLLIEATLDTYEWLPPGRAMIGESYVSAMTTLMGQSFRLGVRAAAPAMAALLLATLILGLIGRTLPQINILVVGFSVNALLTAGAVLVSIGAIAWAFPQQAVASVEMMVDAVHAAATGESEEKDPEPTSFQTPPPEPRTPNPQP